MSAFNQGFVPQELLAALPGCASSCLSPRHLRDLPCTLRLLGLTPSSVVSSTQSRTVRCGLHSFFFLSSNLQITLTVSACSSNRPLAGIHSFASLTPYSRPLSVRISNSILRQHEGLNTVPYPACGRYRQCSVRSRWTRPEQRPEQRSE